MAIRGSCSAMGQYDLNTEGKEGGERGGESMEERRWRREGMREGRRVASFPGPAHSSLTVRNSLRGPGLVHHVMSATVVFLHHQIMFAVLPIERLQ